MPYDGKIKRCTPYDGKIVRCSDPAKARRCESICDCNLCPDHFLVDFHFSHCNYTKSPDNEEILEWEHTFELSQTDIIIPRIAAPDGWDPFYCYALLPLGSAHFWTNKFWGDEPPGDGICEVLDTEYRDYGTYSFKLLMIMEIRYDGDVCKSHLNYIGIDDWSENNNWYFTLISTGWLEPPPYNRVCEAGGVFPTENVYQFPCFDITPRPCGDEELTSSFLQGFDFVVKLP